MRAIGEEIGVDERIDPADIEGEGGRRAADAAATARHRDRRDIDLAGLDDVIRIGTSRPEHRERCDGGADSKRRPEAAPSFTTHLHNRSSWLKTAQLFSSRHVLWSLIIGSTLLRLG